MKDLFDQLYVFSKEGPLRVTVTKFEKGKPERGGYVLMGDGCSCPGMQKTRECKHQKMWNGALLGSPVPTIYAIDFVEKLTKFLGQPYERPDTRGLPPTMTSVTVTMKKTKGFTKAVGFVKFEPSGGSLMVVIEVAK